MASSDPVLVLDSDEARAVVDVDKGGRISSLVVRGHELLVIEDVSSDPLTWGCYPMVPFAGRLAGGIIDFEENQYRLPATMGEHAIHGYGHVNAWTRIGEETITWEFDRPWPFAGRAVQQYRLTSDGLHIAMKVTADERQPISIGWHPWFNKRLSTGEVLELEFRPGRMYEIGSDEIPTGRLVPPAPGPWDNCFTDVASSPTLRWGPLTLQLDATTDHWVVYDQPEHATCVEPQSGPPNDINFAPRVLDDGESTTITFTMSWSFDRRFAESARSQGSGIRIR